MSNLLEQAGARPQKEPKFVPLFMDREFTGLYTQRSVLHDPSDVATSRFYGGRPDALWMGSNVELTNRLTLQRRPGLTEFSSATYPTPPLRTFAFELTNGTIQVIVDTESTVYVDNQNGTKTTLFTKSANAGQTSFVAVAGILFMGDGVDTRIYNPLNTTGTKVFNFGIAFPTQPPSLTIVASGASSVQWQASTMFTTMGLLLDSNGNIQQLVSVNALGNNTTQFGTSGSGQPNWNQTLGGTTVDNTVMWTNQGQLTLWQANTAYPLETPIWDPVSNGIYQSSGGTSGGSKPNFNGSGPVVGGNNRHVQDNNISWIYIGQATTWTPSTTFNSWWENSPQLVCEPVLPTIALLTAPITQKIYLQTSNDAPAGHYTNTPGTTSASFSNPPWGVTAGFQTTDNQLTWLCLGSGTWTADTNYTQWNLGQAVFSVVVDPMGNFQVCTTSGASGSTEPLRNWQASHAYTNGNTIAVKFGTQYVQFTVTSPGTSGASQPTWDFTTGHTTVDNGVTWTSNGPTTNNWGQNYGEQGTDGTVVWTNVGQTSAWAASTIWYLPKGGFSPPTGAQPYGGASVIANGDVQFVIESGLSGATAPAWGAIGTTVVDNTITWYTDSVFSANSLSWTIGHNWAFSYKSRALTDPYSPLPLGGGDTPPGLGIPPNPPGPLGPPLGAQTGAISTASPAATITGANTGAVVTITGPYSPDPAVDTIVIWRDADGGGPDNMFESTEIPNYPALAGVQQWSFEDFLPDVPTSAFPGLNNLIPAPINGQNNPPPSNFLPMVYNFQRIWGASGQTVIFSGGPDVITGNPNFAYNPEDEFPYLASVIRCVKNSGGLVVFLSDSIELIAGGPSTASFYQVTLGPGIGLGNFNGLDFYAGEIYFISSDGRLLLVNPALNVSDAGFPIGDKLAAFNPALSYVAVQQAGIDNAVYVTDGSTGWYRCNPHQVPGGANGPEPIWSPFATITNGCGMVQSIEVTPGIKKLLVGSTSNNQPILERNLSVFTDNGTQYDAWFTMGSIMLAHPGQLAVLKFLEMDFSGVSYRPTVSYLLNEIAGSFTPFSAPPVFDPPSIYGTAFAPTSYSPNRYYFAGNASLARCRHLQVMVDFGTTSNGDEMYNMTIFGRLMVEG